MLVSRLKSRFTKKGVKVKNYKKLSRRLKSLLATCIVRVALICKHVWIDINIRTCACHSFGIKPQSRVGNKNRKCRSRVHPPSFCFLHVTPPGGWISNEVCLPAYLYSYFIMYLVVFYWIETDLCKHYIQGRDGLRKILGIIIITKQGYGTHSNDFRIQCDR